MGQNDDRILSSKKLYFEDVARQRLKLDADDWQRLRDSGLQVYTIRSGNLVVGADVFAALHYQRARK